MNKVSLQNIINYLRDKLSNEDRYSFEKEVAKDPFLEDAMEGFAQLTVDELENDLLKLDTHLKTRLQKTKSRKLMPFFKIAATITIIVGIGSMAIYLGLSDISKKEIAENTTPISVSEEYEIVKIPVNEARKLLDDFEENENQKQIAQTVPKTKQEKDELHKPSLKNKVVVNSKNEEPIAESIIIIDDLEMESSEINIEADIEENIQAQPVAMMSSTPSKEITVLNNDSTYYTIKGIIVDATTKEPIPFATIITNSRNSSIADQNGIFDLTVIDDSILQISYNGYKTEQVSINELANNNNQIELEAYQIASIEETQQKDKRRASKVSIKAKKYEITESSGGAEPITLEYNKTNWVSISYDYEIDIHASPINGTNKFEKYIKNNSNLKPESPTVVKLEFIVEEDGSINNIIIKESPNEIFSNEAIRLIKNSPKWESAMDNGKEVKEKVTVSITFQQ